MAQSSPEVGAEGRDTPVLAGVGVERFSTHRGMNHRAWLAVLVVVALLGVISRAAPLLDLDGRLFRQWPSEDGYLMLTIARNLAIGKGVTVNDGEMQTNGTQPLSTLVFAAVFAAVDGDRHDGVVGVYLWQIATGLLAAAALYALIAVCLAARSDVHGIAATTAALWFAGPSFVPHLMNGQETSTYLLSVLLSILLWVRGLASSRFGRGRALGVGAILGITFWVRNDAVFLVAAIVSCHVILALGSGRAAVRQRLVDSIVMAAASAAIATPWLVYNVIEFGSPIPTSGLSQSTAASLVTNVALMPYIALQYLTVLAPIPHEMSRHAGGQLLLGLALVACIPLLLRVLREVDRIARPLVAVVVVYSALLVVFYGAFFGAPYFLVRYMMPISPFAVLLTVIGLSDAWRAFAESASRLGRATAATVASALLVALLARSHYGFYARGPAHMHWQVIEWVRQNVRDDTWVGAIQSGTLGFFHDRTINLDGKVNADALRARLSGRTAQYVAESPIECLVDWTGIATWNDAGPLRHEFELIVLDTERNLAVLKRVH